jgi:fructose-bisphosphate aldolase/2-amino-3,7-dideoxy-D-threo-hept-6-ulosonate synthase
MKQSKTIIILSDNGAMSMFNLGKKMRLRRLFEPKTGTTFMFAISHGTAAPVVLEGLDRIKEMVRHAIKGGADVIYLSRGMANYVADEFARNKTTCFALKISASATGASIPNQEVLISSIEEAVILGADAVVALIPLAPENETQIISWVGKIGEKCYRLGMPFIAEAEYPASYAPGTPKIDYGEKVEYLKRSARLCAELGADIVKTNWTGSVSSFREIVKVAEVPVIVAGGSRESDKDLLAKIELAMNAGAVGCSVGRNIFQHRNPELMVKAISKVVHREMSAEEAYQKILKQKQNL